MANSNTKWWEYVDDPNLTSKLIELKKVCFIINAEINRLKVEGCSIGEIKKLMSERLTWRKYHKNIERAYIDRHQEYLQREREYRRRKVLNEEILSFCKNKK